MIHPMHCAAEISSNCIHQGHVFWRIRCFVCYGCELGRTPWSSLDYPFSSCHSCHLCHLATSNFSHPNTRLSVLRLNISGWYLVKSGYTCTYSDGKMFGLLHPLDLLAHLDYLAYLVHFDHLTHLEYPRNTSTRSDMPG